MLNNKHVASNCNYSYTHYQLKLHCLHELMPVSNRPNSLKFICISPSL